MQIWERDPVTSAEVSSFGDQWDSISVYNRYQVVTYNNLLYISLITNNQNNNPASVPTAWTQFDLVKRWNVNETYQVRDPVIASDATLYLSQVANNLGNDPTIPSANWAASGAGSGATFSFTDWDLSTTYAAGGANIVTGSNGKYYVSILAGNIGNDPTTPSPLWWTEIDFITQGNITIDDDVIVATGANSDINLVTNGTGKPLINGVEIADTAYAAPIADPTFTGEIGIGAVNVDETELGILEGATATTAELNKLDGVTASTAEINIMDGVTKSTAQINDGAERTSSNTFSGSNTFSSSNDFTGTLSHKGKDFLCRGRVAVGVLGSNVNCSSVSAFGPALLINTSITMPAGSYGIANVKNSISSVTYSAWIGYNAPTQLAVTAWDDTGTQVNVNNAVVSFVFYE